MDREVICKLVIVESYNKILHERRLTKEEGQGWGVLSTAEVCLVQMGWQPLCCDWEAIGLFHQESSSRIEAEILILLSVGVTRKRGSRGNEHG